MLELVLGSKEMLKSTFQIGEVNSRVYEIMIIVKVTYYVFENC